MINNDENHNLSKSVGKENKVMGYHYAYDYDVIFIQKFETMGSLAKQSSQGADDDLHHGIVMR